MNSEKGNLLIVSVFTHYHALLGSLPASLNQSKEALCAHELRSALSFPSAPERILGAWKLYYPWHEYFPCSASRQACCASTAKNRDWARFLAGKMKNIGFLFTKQCSHRFDSTVWTLCTHWPQPMTPQLRYYITLRRNCQTRLFPSKGQFTQLVPWPLEVFLVFQKKGWNTGC